MRYKLFILLSTVLLLLFPIIVRADDFDSDGIPDIWERKNGLRIDKKDAAEDYVSF